MIRGYPWCVVVILQNGLRPSDRVGCLSPAPPRLVQVTNLSSTADQDEQEQESDQPQRETVLSTAMEDVQTRHEGELESSAGDEKEGEGGGKEGGEEGSEEGTGGDAPGVKYSEGKGDVTYV